MRTLRDCFGNKVRLTDERRAHILEHPEMKGMAAEIERVLIQPQLVRCSRSDAPVRLFYEFYAPTIVGGKWLCVVVKYGENALLDGELAGRDAKILSSVIARLGVADVRAFGLAWDDCEELLHQLGFSPRVEVVAA